ncbi:MAG: prepilin-type N-terminal cleavage/methylation domain-containing protein [Actinomycetes bacterium]|jgi:type IV pilus assembly protein PilA
MLARIRKAQEENEGGFTLIELLVVIIIIGILAAIAIPVFLNQRKKGWDSAVKSDLKNSATAQETYMTDNGHYTNVIANLTADGFKYSAGSNYDGGTALLTVDTLYDGNGAATTTVASATGGYCMSGTSASGNVFTYDSTTGGIGGGTPTSSC